MKNLLPFVCACVVCQSCLATPVRVAYIIDGDTFVGDVLLADKTEVKSVKVRLRNVDTPELHGNCESEIKQAKFAKQRLGELIPIDSVVEIENVKNDKYAGRIDANVYDAANRDVGRVLVKEKVGRSYNGGKRKSWCE
ncbi:MAG: thermonuclease family protein [Alphaproteobacteria bacterium]|nr:thermonuclease family protein [Alphaproteobacteria bacterium]